MQFTHLDIRVAYLNADLDHPVYLHRPDGTPDSCKKFWLLKKSLYGLKQAGNLWQKCLDNALKDLNFRQSLADPCVYTRGSLENLCIILVFVDDIALFTKNKSVTTKVVKELSQKFQLRNLGPAKNYIGLEVEKTPNGYKLSQKGKIESLLKKYNMHDCKTVCTPLITGFEKGETESAPCNVELYRTLLGHLSYLANWTRPDIATACNILSRVAHKPTQHYWLAAKRILRYLKHTINWSLHFEPKGEIALKAYVDASFGTDVTDRKSTTGLVIFLADCPVLWKSLKQKTVTLSTAEAEFCALATLCNELEICKQLLVDLNVPINKTAEVFEDNLATIQIAKSEGVKSRNRHTDLRYHKVRECVQQGDIDLKYCDTSHNIADMFTKSQTAEKHMQHCMSLLLHN